MPLSFYTPCKHYKTRYFFCFQWVQKEDRVMEWIDYLHQFIPRNTEYEIDVPHQGTLTESQKQLSRGALRH